MNQDEAIMLLEYVSAACPAQRVGEFTPDVWGELLAPYDLTDARAAVLAVARRQPFVSPAEIITEIKERREERIALANVVYDGDPAETGIESARSVRALLRAAASGQIPPRTPSAALGTAKRLALPPGEPGPYAGRAAAARAAVGQAIPRVREGVVNPRAISCRRCQALPGASCSAGGRRMNDVHPGRLEDARRAAAGLPPIDPAEEEREQARRIAASAARAAADTTQPDFEDAT
ncbi:hypothetical protein [Streptomyces sp. IB2014 016-6]|uniref:zinc finger domain-containing protein n=1 Tax=Streptomyces sp. IB2014 016-6 TaxID=2517818 RepID=UPI0011CC0FAF|nr:hypothetical protein [Streptomyces sp. IB2014 016-6]TXL91623.1 hypothetical protein EW053_04670 [Streptomyces sp. IB2014 016-6]